jgi:hypothetical protein
MSKTTWSVLAVLVLVIILFSVNVSSQLSIEEGGDGSLIVWRNPFYIRYENPSLPSLCSFFLNITNPLNRSMFFFPNITPNVTFNLSGALTPDCYTATNGNWTNRPCGNGVNWYLETLPEGYPTEIKVRVYDGCGYVEDNVYVKVFYGAPQLSYVDEDYIVIFFLFGGFLLLLLACYQEGYLDQYIKLD